MKKIYLSALVLFGSLVYAANAMAGCPVEYYEIAKTLPQNEWSFNKTYVEDKNNPLKWRYDLDTTHHLAVIRIYENASKVPDDKIFNIPDAVEIDGEWYVVVALGRSDYTSSSDATQVILPETLRRIGKNGLAHFDKIDEINIPASVETIEQNAFAGASGSHPLTVNMPKGQPMPATTGKLSSGASTRPTGSDSNRTPTWYVRVMVDNDQFINYLYADYWEDCVIIDRDNYDPDDNKTNWTVLDRVEDGTLGYAVVGNEGMDKIRMYNQINCLKVNKGSLNEDDWFAIRQMKNLVKLDVSGMEFTRVPDDAAHYCWQLERVVLPDCVNQIGNYAFAKTNIGRYSTYDPTVGAEGKYDFHMPASLATIGTNAFNDCDQLRNIVIPEGVKDIPYQAFYSCSRLNRADLPSELKTFGTYAFANCRLINHEIPGTVANISSYCYAGNTKLQNLKLNEGLQNISMYAFENCSVLDNVVTPQSLRVIDRSAFSGCAGLHDINLQEGLEEIQSTAFYSCTGLEKITLPSTLRLLKSVPFHSCTNIKTINCYSLIPPTVDGETPIYGNSIDTRDIALNVPRWSIQEYMTTPGWIEFQGLNMGYLPHMPENLYINKEFSFMFDSQEAGYLPNLKLLQNDTRIDDGFGHTKYERGNLTVSGVSNLHLSDFGMTVSPWAKYYADNDKSGSTYYDYENNTTKYNSNSLVVHGSVDALTSTMKLQLRRDTWHAVHFDNLEWNNLHPVDPETQFSIRRYSASARAAGLLGEAWEVVTPGSKLDGDYFIKCYNSDSKYSSAPIEFTMTWPTVSASWTTLSSQPVTKEYPTYFADDPTNGTWTLTGSPYPCFYDSRRMTIDFKDGETRSFLVWNSYTRKYDAYQLGVDAYDANADRYVFSPYESFFVQGPAKSGDKISVNFPTEGRQTHINPVSMVATYNSNSRIGQQHPRHVYNIIATTSDESDYDRTRIVIDEEASADYVIGQDLAKMMPSEMNTLLLWTKTARETYSINERPMGDGEVSLAMNFGHTGYYTLALGGNAEGVIDDTYRVYIEDIDAGTMTEISDDNTYSFFAEEGLTPGRFYVHFVERSNPTAIKSAVKDAEGGDIMYNLAGQRISTSQNGVVVKQGKKVLF